MASLKDMRVRIAATKATQKITKAMQMVAASKLRRAQVAAEAARPYAERMEKVLGNIAASVGANPGAPRLLAGTGADQVHLFSSAPPSAGCAGRSTPRSRGSPANAPTPLLADGKEVKFFCVGRKGFEQLRRLYENRIVETVDLRAVRQIRFENADEIGRKIVAMFNAGQFDVCTLFFSRFRSVIAQMPTAQQLIPAVLSKAAASSGGAVYEYEPDEEDILAELLPRNISVQVFRALLENAASFYGAQMTRDGQRHPQCRRHDPQADPDLQPHPPGDDHQGTDRDHLRRRGAVSRAQNFRNEDDMAKAVGHITQVIGAVVDVQVRRPPAGDPERAGDRQPRQPPGARSRPASRRDHGAHHRHGHHRRPGARPGGHRHRRADRGAGRRRHARPHHERDRRAGRRSRADQAPRTRADPRSRPRALPTNRPRPKFSSPASRWSICSRLMPRAARSACSAAPASARPC